MADDPRKAKLDFTISSVTPARLEATRQEVEVERQKITSPKPPPPETEDMRSAKLDLIQDVQLILVDKYRKGTTIMTVALGAMVLSLAGFVHLYFRISKIQAQQAQLIQQQAQLVQQQEQLLEHGDKIERTADETNQKIDTANQKLDETKQKVTQAVDDAPKIEIDDSGKAKVVLPVKTSTPVSKPKHPPTPPSASATPSSAPLPPQVPVETQRL